MMTRLEELRLLCKWTSFFYNRYDGTWCKAFSDQDMNCFRKLRGWKKVVIKGHLSEVHTNELLGCMEKPPIDFTGSRHPRLVVPRSKFSGC